jgi:hypothetical protein
VYTHIMQLTHNHTHKHSHTHSHLPTYLPTYVPTYLGVAGAAVGGPVQRADARCAAQHHHLRPVHLRRQPDLRPTPPPALAPFPCGGETGRGAAGCETRIPAGGSLPPGGPHQPQNGKHRLPPLPHLLRVGLRRRRCELFQRRAGCFDEGRSERADVLAGWSGCGNAGHGLGRIKQLLTELEKNSAVGCSHAMGMGDQYTSLRAFNIQCKLKK